MRPALWGLFAAVLLGIVLAALIGRAVPVLAHGTHDWMRKFETPAGVSCCDETDVVPIGHAEANAAHVGTVITADFPNYPAMPVAVQVIYQTEDPAGRPMLSRWGCLWRAFGS